MLINKANELKVINIFSKNESINYMILKNIFFTRIINLEELYIKITREKNQYYIQLFDENIIEEKIKINEEQELTKKDFKVRVNKKLRVFNEFSVAVDRMIAGEYVDTEYEGKEISSEYLEYTHKNKTGALLKLCVRMGAILADCNEKNLEKLTEYAEKIGLAFQIKDDILSVEGNELITGKPVGNDEEKGKCTYVSKYGLEKAKSILEEITKDAIKITNDFGEKAEFLTNLAEYIKDRNK